MKKFISFFFIVCFSMCVFAQQKNDTIGHDPKAKTFLDKFSKKIKSLSTIRVDFSYTLNNKAAKVKDSYNGFVFLKGTKYKLILPGNEVFSDGKTVWTYMKEAKEVNVTEPDPEDESVLNPGKLFTMYEKGFKYRLKNEGKEKVKIKTDGKIKEVDKNVTTIDLYPEKPLEKKYSIIRLKIDKNDLTPYSFKYQGKDGIDYTIDIVEFKADVKINDNIFVYDPSRFPSDVELIDLRE